MAESIQNAQKSGSRRCLYCLHTSRTCKECSFKALQCRSKGYNRNRYPFERAESRLSVAPPWLQTPSKGSDKDTSIFIIVNYFLYSAIVSSMTLPEVCPLDETQTCKGRECHLFCLEWRTREPNCLIGYGTTSKIKSGKVDRNSRIPMLKILSAN